MGLFNMFKEDNGNVSSMRITMFIITLCCMVDYMFSTFTKGQWKPSPEIITILLGSLGLKMGQKFAESKKLQKEAAAKKPRAPKVVSIPTVFGPVGTPPPARGEYTQTFSGVPVPQNANQPTTTPTPFKP